MPILHLQAYTSINTAKPLNIIHPINGNTPLGFAATYNHLAAFEALLDNGADPNHVNHHGWNALRIAAVNKSFSIPRALFNHCELWHKQFDVSARDKKERTALMLLE